MTTRRSEPRLAAPGGLVASTFNLVDDEFVLFEWPAPGDRPKAPELTQAEREVLELVLAGLSNAEIGSRRGRSPRTVANQIASLFRRLGVASRLELFALAASWGSGIVREG